MLKKKIRPQTPDRYKKKKKKVCIQTPDIKKKKKKKKFVL